MTKATMRITVEPQRYIGLLLAMLTFAAMGCGHEDIAQPTPVQTSRQAEPPSSSKSDEHTKSKTVPARREFPITGVVRRFDRENRIVTLMHDEIPGYMPPMTMPIELADDSVLDEIQLGDKLTATLVVTDDKSTLQNVIITELGEPSPPESESTLAAKRLAVGDLASSFTVTTQGGESLRLEDLRGEVVAMTFIYTRCPLPDFCPLLDRKFADLSRRVALLGERGTDIRLLSVSFDPEHDTPEVLRKHAQVVGAIPPRWSFAVASHDELQRAGPSFGLTYGDTGKEIIHTLSTVVIGKDGRIEAMELGNKWTVDDLFSIVRRANRAEQE